jgi:hypothetical protein
LPTKGKGFKVFIYFDGEILFIYLFIYLFWKHRVFWASLY